MELTKYKFRQSEEYSEEVNMTLTELYKDIPELSKSTIKELVVEKATIKGGKIKLFKKNATASNRG